MEKIIRKSLLWCVEKKLSGKYCLMMSQDLLPDKSLHDTLILIIIGRHSSS